MIKQIFQIIICFLKKHKMVDGGSCPFTGKSYLACLRCGITVEK